MKSLESELNDQIAGIAWSLWSSLGVPGIERFHDNCLIQLEELIILTSMVADFDPRLRDEALDWLSRYHECCSISRLKSLSNHLETTDKNLFFKFANTLNETSSSKWPKSENIGRFKPKLSSKATPLELEKPSLLNLRLRFLFSPGVKADVLTHLLTNSEINFSSSDLVQIGYSKRSIMTALDHLVASGFLTLISVRNQKKYEIKKPKELRVVIGKLPKIAPPWFKILQAIILLRSIFPQLEKSSDTTKGIILRNCLRKIEPLLPAFVSPVLDNIPDFKKDWKSIIEILNAMRQGDFYMQYQVFDEFEKVTIDILRNLYQVDDCIDGIEIIERYIELNQKKHLEIYKECYQLFLSFAKDLEVRLEYFFKFPFHKAMDETLSDLPYHFSQEQLPSFLQKLKQLKPIMQIDNPLLAIRQYKLFMPELTMLRQFLNTFRKRLQDLYFINTRVYLLTSPDVLFKRHLVIDLFKEF